MDTETASAIEEAGTLLRKRMHHQAIPGYVRAILADIENADILSFNLRLARRRWRSDRVGQPLSVAVCGWELSHNAAGRVRALADIWRGKAKTEIIGATFAHWGDSLWPPIAGTDLPCHTIHVADDRRFLSQALDLVLAHPYDIVHLSKPRMPNILFGLLYKLIWDAKVILDIDDEELGAVAKDTTLTLDALIEKRGGEIDWTGLAHGDWTQVAVGCAGIFNDVTVSNPSLQARYGGIVLPHARPAAWFEDDRGAQLRAEHGIAPEKTVVLFFGTPRKHKGLFETAQAIASLGRDDLCYLIVGNFPDPKVKEALEAIDGLDLRFLPGQPYESIPDVMALGDICVLLQSENSLLARYQVPAKLVDALGAGLLVLAQPTSGMMGFVEQGVVVPTSAELLIPTLARWLDDAPSADRMRAAGQAFFRKHLSTDACRPLLDEYGDNFRPRPDPALMFDSPAQQSLFEALGGWRMFCEPEREQSDPTVPVSASSPVPVTAASSAPPAADRPPRDARVVVYSVLIGDYEAVKEPEVLDPSVRYILFTDDPKLRNDKWEICLLTDCLSNGRRTSRLPKILPHLYLPEHDVSIYIDSSLTWRAADVHEMVRECLKGHDIAIYPHHKRDCIYDEIDECERLGIERPDLIKFYREYYKNIGIQKKAGLFENTLIIRRNNAAVRNLNESWMRMYLGQRDQLSLVAAIRTTDTYVHPISIGRQVRNNPYVTFQKHNRPALSTARPKIYAFIAFAPPHYGQDLGRTYNDYMERVDEDAFVVFLDHDAMFCGSGWYDIVRDYADGNLAVNEGLLIGRTNRVGNPYQRVGVLENEHRIAPHIELSQNLRESQGDWSANVSSLNSSSGVVLGMSKSTWRVHPFSSGFLQVDNKMHISFRSQQKPVYMINALYVYHFYRADGDFSHAKKLDAQIKIDSKKVVLDSAPSNENRLRVFILEESKGLTPGHYSSLLEEGESAVFIRSNAMFCDKYWYLRLYQQIDELPEEALLVFSNNLVDNKSPKGDDILEHRDYASRAILRNNGRELCKEKVTLDSLVGFMVSKSLLDRLVAEGEGESSHLLGATLRLGGPILRDTTTYVFSQEKINKKGLVSRELLPQKNISVAIDRARRVGVLTLGFWPAQAGMEMMIHNLATHLSIAGDLVTLYAPKPKKEYTEISHNYLLIRFRDEADFLARFRKQHAVLPFDVILVQGGFEAASMALKLKAELGVAIVLRTHGEDFQTDEATRYGYRLDPAKREIIDRNVSSVDSNIVIGAHIEPLVRAIHPKGDIRLIHNGVDVERFCRASGDERTNPLREKFSLNSDTPILLMVGRNVRKKAFHLALEALAIVLKKVPNAVLIHAGKDGNAESLDRVAERLNVTNNFFQLGEVDYFEIPSLYAAADLFVFPSKMETFGNVTIEALSSGLPCIEFDYGVNRNKIIHDENGYILPFGDVAGMAEKIVDLLEDKAKLIRFANSARSHAVQNFGWAAIAEQYRDVFQRFRTDKATRRSPVQGYGYPPIALNKDA